MIVVPGLEHIAIPAIRLLGSSSPLVIIDNGLHLKDRIRIVDAIPSLKIFKLYTNGITGQQMVDTHPEVMETLTHSNCDMTIFIDADCYVFKYSLIDKVFEELKDKLFVSPFFYENHLLKQKIPETFLIGINKRIYNNIKKKYGIQFGESVIPTSLVKKAESRWGKPIPWLHPWKKKFDTIHVTILASLVEHLKIGTLETSDEYVQHVCATSYSIKKVILQYPDDEFLLNAHFFHMRLLEELRIDRINECLLPIIKHYINSEELKNKYPEFEYTATFSNTNHLLKKLKESNVLY
jgi:hypothetical protein